MESDLPKCCCFSLQTGGIIIGVLDIIGAILMISFFSDLLTKATEYEEPKLEVIVYSIVVSIYIIQIICATFLILGIFKQKLSFIRSWIIYSRVIAILRTLVIFGSLIKGALLSFLVHLLLIGFLVYFIHAIGKLHNQMKEVKVEDVRVENGDNHVTFSSNV